MTEFHLIAENDERGNVLWLWRWDGANSRPRPLAPEALGDLALKNARIHGASRAAVSEWLQHQGARC